MPFSFSHPAIVLPFRRVNRQYRSMTGLVIGSMVPDFEYFIRMKVESVYSHTWSGLFWFDLSLGVMLTLIYQFFVKDAFIRNLPLPLNQRLSVYKGLDVGRQFGSRLRYVLIVMVSVLVGAATHLLWDGFTHGTGYFVWRYPVLAKNLYLRGYFIHVYKILQHVSTVIGLLAIVYTIYILPKIRSGRVERSKGYWLEIIATALLIAAIRFITSSSPVRIGDLIVTLISGSFIGLLIASVSVRFAGAGRTVATHKNK